MVVPVRAAGYVRPAFATAGIRSATGSVHRRPRLVADVIMATLLTNCSVVDGVSDTARPDTSVLVDGGRIRAVGPAGELRGAADEIDLHGAFVMAGLINMHVHFVLILPGVEGDRLVGESDAAIELC